MEERVAVSRHFFKVMIPGFQQRLNLPPGFCKKLKEEKSRQAMVRTRKGSWKMKVCRNPQDGLMSLEDGWGEFVCAHGLSVGDFVVFEHTGGLLFNALVFDPSACEKEFLVEFKEEDDQESPEGNCSKRKSGKKAVNVSYHSKKPHFILIMKPYHAHKLARVTIPVKFLRSNNLEKMSSVVFRNPDHHQRRAWSVRVLVEETPTLRARMDRGWHDFYVSNKLKDGDFASKLQSKAAKRRGLVAMAMAAAAKAYHSPLLMAAQKPTTTTVSSKKNTTVFPLGEPGPRLGNSASTQPVKLLTRVEQLRLLSKAEKAGLLSAAEKFGLSLSTIERLGLLSKAEELGVLSAATDPGTPSTLFSLSLFLLVLGPACVYLVPEDYPWEIGLQVVVALLSVAGGSAAFAASNLVSTLQKSN
ncbi:B3 domain-containing protein REM9 [Sesamum alatum]|uniref:B3 domain-containing protein REM9 n=1 Tax=Sesamum alatum TaxID=300844 RepID=A0AAE2CMJ6_9LAMI|nr:B3 domain-containing protein REM9 [Sesamum alatum]